MSNQLTTSIPILRSQHAALLILALGLWLPLLSGQPEAFRLHIQPVWQAQDIHLDESLRSHAGDSLVLHTLKLYLGHFDFFKNGRLVFQDPGYRLLNLEDESSLDLLFEWPGPPVFDSLRFDFGTDSLSNVSGALGGALDPSLGMYWSWQSGYINAKIEGYASACPARGHLFQLHLGGYLPPAATCFNVTVPAPATGRIDWDLAPFFGQIDWRTQHSILSPGPAAAQVAARLAQSFRKHESP